ncbi:MCE family protein [Nocardioides speluncae]|uniref:MCE family protein n=1 Tax=Nocardioides speluncae TaxID=2670337 RepID=UPI000D68BA78|nr:MlaD family protein [Nocardioides speluncae]
MSRGVRIRIAAFMVLSAVGIVYVAGEYLGIVDRILGRGYTIHATLPESGGLYEGSQVTYRGVGVGEVVKMTPTKEGVTLDLAMEEGVRIPRDARIEVHNLSAVGEQYLDFLPEDESGPYLGDGQTLAGDADSLPVSEEDLLVEVDQFVNSVDKENLATVVEELGTMFRDTGRPLEQLLDGGTEFIDEASANQDETIALLDQALVVLQTQQDESENIRSLARDLKLITASLRASDKNLRTVLSDTPALSGELTALLKDLEPSLPVLLANAVTVDQVLLAHLPGIEQLLVTFPRLVSNDLATPPSGWGITSLQLDSGQAPCREGYLPPSEWRQGDDVADRPHYPARCLSGPPFNMRGSKYAPAPNGAYSSGRTYGRSYDPTSGIIDGLTDTNGESVRLGDQGNLSILGGDSWKWLLVGPVATR